jgi:hypothetical protein
VAATFLPATYGPLGWPSASPTCSSTRGLFGGPTALCCGVRLSADPGHRADRWSAANSVPTRRDNQQVGFAAQCPRSALPLCSSTNAEPLKDPPALRARTLVARSIENAGTAHSVHSLTRVRPQSRHIDKVADRLGHGHGFSLDPANAHANGWLHYRRNETRCGTREELQCQVNSVAR